MTATKDLALTRAEQELPEITDCEVSEAAFLGYWFVEWPRDSDFDPFCGYGATPALAHAAMLDKLTDALAEKRMRDEDGEREDAGDAAYDAMVEDGL